MNFLLIATCFNSSKKKGAKDPGCDIFMEGFSNGHGAEIDMECRTDKRTYSLQQNITYSEGIPDTSAQGFKIFEEVDGHRYAIRVPPETSLVIDDLRISGFRDLGAVVLVRCFSLHLSNVSSLGGERHFGD